MNNNDILRRLRYALNISDSGAQHIFKLIDVSLEGETWVNFLKKEEDEGFEPCSDAVLESFLDGYIVFRRGKSNGPPPKPTPLSNNQILRKLKIALKLDDKGMIDILDQADFRVSKSELTALFRRPEHPKFKPCGNQFLRNFLIGLTKAHRKEPQSQPARKPFSKPGPPKKD